MNFFENINKHQKAYQILLRALFEQDEDSLNTYIDILKEYFIETETTEKAYEEVNLLLDLALRDKRELEVKLGQLKRDVKMYFEISSSLKNKMKYQIELKQLEIKLSKVGVEE